MRLEGAIGKTLTGLALAAAFCLNAGGDNRLRRRELPEARAGAAMPRALAERRRHLGEYLL